MERRALAFTAPARHERAVNFFCKSLYAFVLIKLVLSWPTLMDLAGIYVMSPPRSMPAWMAYGPAVWSRDYLTAFLVVFAMVLVAALWVRPNYFTATVIAWFTLSLWRIAYPVSNGGDQVLQGLLFLAIPLSAYPVVNHPAGELLQRAAHHSARIFGKLYVCMIYFVSGADKLGSAAWRSGEALGRVRGLTYKFNPAFDVFLPTGHTGLLLVSWAAIAFELLFPVLVWFKAARPWVLRAGIVFHLIIAFMLSIPDFAVVMIVSYGLFRTDKRQALAGPAGAGSPETIKPGC